MDWVDRRPRTLTVTTRDRDVYDRARTAFEAFSLGDPTPHVLFGIQYLVTSVGYAEGTNYVEYSFTLVEAVPVDPLVIDGVATRVDDRAAIAGPRETE